MTAEHPLAVLRRLRQATAPHTAPPAAAPSGGSAAAPTTQPAPGVGPGAPALGRCELCGEPFGEPHAHLVDLQSRRLLCACRACGLLFAPEGAGQGRYRAVPHRYLSFPDGGLTAAQWDALQIPVGVAFFFHNSILGRMVAFYPGPAGATESELSMQAWDDVVGSHPALATLEPDVEAVLVRAAGPRMSGSPENRPIRPENAHTQWTQSTKCAELHLVPVDTCYELVGRLRRLWRGFDGGREANDAIDDLFDKVRKRAVPE